LVNVVMFRSWQIHYETDHRQAVIKRVKGRLYANNWKTRLFESRPKNSVKFCPNL